MIPEKEVPEAAALAARDRDRDMSPVVRVTSGGGLKSLYKECTVRCS